MITSGKQLVKPCYNLNKELLSLEGELSEEKAKETLASFLAHNIHVTWELLTNVRLYDYQSIILKGWFLKNFNMNIICRGGAKTEMAAYFCLLYSVLYPSARIAVLSSGFRRSREILERADKILKSKDAELLRQCFASSVKRKNDEFRLDTLDGYILALPLTTGNPLRGTRCSIAILDEMLTIPEDTYNSVIFPFLVANVGIQDAIKLKEVEETLIKKGLMKEEDREIAESMKKVICLSSASYKFDFLFRLYQEWINKIIDGPKKNDQVRGSYLVVQMGYESLPDTLIDPVIINEAKESAMSDSTFQREYAAIFTDDSSGFFSARRMKECTALPGEPPFIEIKGDGSSVYILSIDTNLSKSASADHFSMAVFKINYEAKTVTLCHSFAKSGLEFKDYAVYFYYLMTSFKISYIIYDKTGGGGRFLESCNEMSIFRNNKLKINEWEAKFDPNDYVASLRDAKFKYNLEDKKIAYGQIFTSETIASMNDTLQLFIDKKKVWFPSPLSVREGILNEVRAAIPPFLFLGKEDSGRFFEDFIDDQDDLVDLTKNETALIEMKTTNLGTRSWELPQHLKRSDSPNRARRDSYTTLLLGCYLGKILFDLHEQPTEQTSFTPTFIA